MANEDRWRGSDRSRQDENRPSDRDYAYGGPGRERRGTSREGFWGRGREGSDFDRGEHREYSREDYGRSGYGESERGGTYGGSFSRTGEEGRGGAGYGRQRDDGYAQEASGRRYSGNQGRGFGYGSDYRGSYGGSGYGGDDRGRRDYGSRGSEERGFFERAADEVSSWFGDRDAERRREQDYRGRGPKGYKRSDQRIQEDVNDRLADDPYVDASELEVGVSGGEVTLSGTVDDRPSRRRAEDIAEQVSGVTYVQNNIRVSMVGAASSSDREATAGSVTGGSGSMTSGASTGTSATAINTGLGTDQSRR
ncbi:MAG: BON domain-containing protein [Geminicoccaceae bacterium]